MTRFLPIPDPAGSLQPPRRPPPTALATATPDPEPQRTPAVTALDEAAYRDAQRRCAELLEVLRNRNPFRRAGRRLTVLVTHAVRQLAGIS